MKRLLALALLVAMAAGPVWAAKKQPAVDLESEMPADARHLKIGDAAPDFSLLGVDGKTYTLADFKAAPLLMVAFLSNHCPYSHAAETRLLPLYAEMKDKGLALVAINPDSPAGIAISELGYSKYNDTYDEMKLYAKERGFTFPYLDDGDTQKTAKAYGCLCTPHIFIFDHNRKLVYAGRLDDSPYADPSTVTAFDARDAIVALLAGKPVPVPMTKPFGCSTKWASKKSAIAKANARWESAPVTLAPINEAGVAALVKNNTTQLRLINVWATWCVPCVEEFPNLVSLIIQLQNRNFELISISLDDDSSQSKALQFLQKQHAALPNRLKQVLESEGRSTDNYRFTGRVDSLQKTLDPEWLGPVPYTLIIAPGGKIIYRHLGSIDLAEVRAKLLEQLGPYYNPATNN
ncbi:MAG TPA: redoxin domain-containing protein [Opitutaceae bacterium]|jgi:peroxiredoxin|nr:redoxin domain-containing protein [Opitutaceae bacterium]